MNTIRENHSHVIIRQLLYVSALTSPSSGSAQLHKMIDSPYIVSSKQEKCREFNV